MRTTMTKKKPPVAVRDLMKDWDFNEEEARQWVRQQIEDFERMSGNRASNDKTSTWWIAFKLGLARETDAVPIVRWAKEAV